MNTRFSFVKSFRLQLGLAGFLAVAFALMPPALAQRGNFDMTYEKQSVDQMIAAYMKENKIPGMSVAIVQAPYITRVTGYGYADVSHKLLSASNTLFHLGPIAEAYTAVAVLQLVEQGKVKLDDPIEQHVPLAPQAWHGVTVRQLLQHQSGLPDYTKATPRGPNDPPAELFKAVSETGPTFEPGTQTAPCATDYLLLQLLIETASGQSYEDFVRTNQFNRLGLKHTFFAAELNNLPRETLNGDEHHSRFLTDPALINPTEPATGYQGDEPNPTAVPEARMLPIRAAIYATAEDISLWDIGLAGEILIKDPELRKVLYTPAKLKNGSFATTSGPWSFPGRPGLMLASGSSLGFSAVLARFTDPKELLCVTLLANKEGLDLNPLALKLAAAYDPALTPPPAPTPTPTPTPAPAASPTAAPAKP